MLPKFPFEEYLITTLKPINSLLQLTGTKSILPTFFSLMKARYQYHQKYKPLLIVLSIAKQAVRELPRQSSHSFTSLLLLAYPSHSWEPWKFTWGRLPWGWWQQIDNQRAFLTSIATDLKFASKESFYNLPKSTVVKHGGSELMKIYGQSVANAVMTAFPEHTWQAWRFDKTPRGWWDLKHHQLLYLKWLTTDVLKYKTHDDFYKLNDRVFRKYKGSILFAKTLRACETDL